MKTFKNGRVKNSAMAALVGLPLLVSTGLSIDSTHASQTLEKGSTITTPQHKEVKGEPPVKPVPKERHKGSSKKVLSPTVRVPEAVLDYNGGIVLPAGSEGTYVKTANGRWWNTTNLYTVPSYVPDVFALNSNPGAAKTIYLNFKGVNYGGAGDVLGGQWSNTKKYAKGFDLDGNYSNWDATEKKVVYTVWRQVTEAFGPLNVNISTAPPSGDGLFKSTDSDTKSGIDLMITDTSSKDITGDELGGVSASIIDETDPNGFYMPTWVFAGGIDAGWKWAMESAEDITDVAVHEAGHGLGLDHDNVLAHTNPDGTTVPYDEYATMGDNAVWNPVLGHRTWQPMATFDKGSYSWAGNKEDDYAVMSSHGLTKLIPTTHTVQQVALGQNLLSKGVINTAGLWKENESHYYGLDLPAATTVTLEATRKDALSPHLDLGLQVLKSDAKTVVATSAPTTTRLSSALVKGGDAGLTVTLPAGRSYVRVFPQGNPGEYTAYGLRGNYYLTWVK